MTIAEEVQLQEIDPYDQDVPTNLRNVCMEYALFVKEDFGFDGPIADYVDRAKAGEKTERLVCERFVSHLKEIMRRHTGVFPKLRPENGAPVMDDKGKVVTEVRSRFLTTPGELALVNAGNPRYAPEFWWDYVEKRWDFVLKNLDFFGATPETDPNSPHTEALVRSRLHPGYPQRRKAIEFLRSRGVEPFKYLSESEKEALAAEERKQKAREEERARKAAADADAAKGGK